MQLGEEWNVTACERCKCEKGYNIVCQITSCADCSRVCHCFFSSHQDVFFLCITEWLCFTCIFTKNIKCTTTKFWRRCFSRQLWWSSCQPYVNILLFVLIRRCFITLCVFFISLSRGSNPTPSIDWNVNQSIVLFTFVYCSCLIRSSLIICFTTNHTLFSFS